MIVFLKVAITGCRGSDFDKHMRNSVVGDYSKPKTSIFICVLKTMISFKSSAHSLFEHGFEAMFKPSYNMFEAILRPCGDHVETLLIPWRDLVNTLFETMFETCEASEICETFLRPS